MPVEIVRNDIARMRVDAIVNTASIQPVIGYGVDSGIHEKAGPKLLAARKRLGVIPVGSAAVTPAFDLDAKYVIHTVCPVWRGGNQGEPALLRQCYDRSLELARRKWCKSIAFPLMSAGNHGFPKDLALEIAMAAIRDFLDRHEMQVYLVVFSRSAWQLSERLHKGVSSFIDECYVQQRNLSQYGVADKCNVRREQQEEVLRHQKQLRRQEAFLEEAEFRDLFDAAPSMPSPWEETEERSFDLRLDPEPDLWEDAFLEAPGDGFPEEAPAQSRKAAPERRQRSSQRPTMKKAAAPALSMPKVKPVALEEMLKKADAGFTETLFQMIDKTGKKDSEIYKKANIDRKHFSKIRKNRNYQPSKPTAVAFAIALELDLEETRDFLARAGFALSRSSTFDIIIEYFILNRNYDIHEINMTLFEFDQSLLGA